MNGTMSRILVVLVPTWRLLSSVMGVQLGYRRCGLRMVRVGEVVVDKDTYSSILTRGGSRERSSNLQKMNEDGA